MSTPILEQRHPGEFLLSEAEGTRSREVVTISDAIAVKVGQVLGKVTADGKYNFYNNADAPAGTGVAVAIAMYPVGAADVYRKVTVIVRDAEVIGAALEWNGAVAGDITAGKADLAALGIIFR